MRRLLVTGGAGFIGSHFVEAALRNSVEESRSVERVVVLDALTYAGKRAHLAGVTEDPRLLFVKGDICDRALVDALFAEHAFDAVVHLAAESHVDRSISDGAPFVATNVVGTFTLLEAARKAWGGDTTKRRFLHVSTDEVYGALGPTGRFTELSPYAPSSPYAASKAAADHFVRAHFVTYGLPVIVTHSCNNIGRRQAAEKFIPFFVRHAIAGLQMPLYGDGHQIREWLPVADQVRGLWRALVAGQPGETYNFAGVCELENRDVAQRVADAVDIARERAPGTSRHLITSVEDRPGHDFRYALDGAKSRLELGWEAKVPFDAALGDVVSEWMATHDSSRDST